MRPNSSNDVTLTNEEILARTRESVGWMFADIETARIGTANVAAVILSVLAMDCFAARRRGYTVTAVQQGDANCNAAFNSFVTDYLRKVDKRYKHFGGRQPYKKLRNLLVHGYSKEGFEFTDDIQEHLQVKEGYLQLHVESFVHDVKTAIMNYIKCLEEGGEDFRKFKSAYEVHPLIGLHEKGKPLPFVRGGNH